MKEFRNKRSKIRRSFVESLFGTVNRRDCHLRYLAFSITLFWRSSFKKPSRALEVLWRIDFCLGRLFAQVQPRPLLIIPSCADPCQLFLKRNNLAPTGTLEKSWLLVSGSSGTTWGRGLRRLTFGVWLLVFSRFVNGISEVLFWRTFRLWILVSCTPCRIGSGFVWWTWLIAWLLLLVKKGPLWGWTILTWCERFSWSFKFMIAGSKIPVSSSCYT